MFKVVQIYLKKETVWTYFFYFVTGGCEKLNNNSVCGDHEKVNETRGLQKVIGVRRQGQEKVGLYKNC